MAFVQAPCRLAPVGHIARLHFRAVDAEPTVAGTVARLTVREQGSGQPTLSPWKRVGRQHRSQLCLVVNVVRSDTPTRFREPANQRVCFNDSWRVRHAEKRLMTRMALDSPASPVLSTVLCCGGGVRPAPAA